MKNYQIYIGDIRQCTSYKGYSSYKMVIYDYMKSYETIYGYRDPRNDQTTKSELVKKDAVLLKFEDTGYIDIDTLKKINGYIIRRKVHSGRYALGDMVMDTEPHFLGSLFVEEPQLYYDSKQDNNKKTYKYLKKKK